MTAASGTNEVVWDTSAWIAWFNDETVAASIREATVGKTVVSTPIILAELAAQVVRGRVKAAEALGEVEKHSRLESVSREDALAAGRLWGALVVEGKHRVGLGDCLIHATARRIGAALVTKDADLSGQPGVVVLKDPAR